MKKHLSSLALILFFVPAIAQKVQNVNWDLDATQENIIITYDLIKEGSGSNSYFNVSIKAALNETPITLQSVTGDVGNYIKAGTGKRIVWAWASDVSEIEGNLKFTISAVDPLNGGGTNPGITNSDKPKPGPTTTTAPRPVPPWAGITGSGGIAATGIGLGIAGLSSLSDSKTLYDTYSTVLDPSDPVYSELTREEFYTEANAKHKKGQWLAYGGGAVMAAGAYMLVSRIVGYNRIKKRAGLSLTPEFTPPQPARISPSATGLAAVPQTGLRLNYRF